MNDHIQETRTDNSYTCKSSDNLFHHERQHSIQINSKYLHFHRLETEQNTLSNVNYNVNKSLHECTLCKKSFSTSSALSDHILTHTVRKKYQCDQCKESFSDHSKFNDHLLAHTGGNHYQCHIGKMNFATSSSVSQHMKIHLEKKYECMLCTKSFTSKQNLNFHIKTHTGDKPYKCPTCGGSYPEPIPLYLVKNQCNVQ